MIPKRQDSEESTEEQEQEETKEGKTHTADKAKKGEIDNGDLSRLTAAAGKKGGTHTGDADVERWQQQSGGSEEFITHMTVKRDPGTGSVPCLHFKLSCSGISPNLSRYRLRTTTTPVHQLHKPRNMIYVCVCCYESTLGTGGTLNGAQTVYPTFLKYFRSSIHTHRSCSVG
jgi:hypothetical protein